jgi:hypothetical protein
MSLADLFRNEPDIVLFEPGDVIVKAGEPADAMYVSSTETSISAWPTNRSMWPDAAQSSARWHSSIKAAAARRSTH